MSKGTGWLWLLGMIMGGAYVFSANCATAQITPDKTLSNNSKVTINGSIFNITEGTQAGRNLFHSFQQFSVPTGGTASFNNGLDIQNIISRVTGGEASYIDGIIKASGTANLFFLNPNGIIFGKNAILNTGGSFVATTANAIEFGNQGTFSASVPNNPALLTVNPSALLYNQIATSASIQNSSTSPAGVAPTGANSYGLRVPDGKSLLLVGGDINMDGGTLSAYGGRVELAGLAVPGRVGINVAGDALSLSVPNDLQLADISLQNQASVSVFGAGGGDIVINARNLNMSSSYLFAGIGTGLGNGHTQAGDIRLNTTGVISLNNAYLESSTFGRGNAGNIFIQTPDSVSLVYTDIFSNVEAGGVGKGGSINITSNSLSLQDASQLQTFIRRADINLNRAAGHGDAGSVNINVRGAVSFTGTTNGMSSDIFSGVDQGTEGNAGNINIKSGSLLLTDGAKFATLSLAKGNAGNIFIEASDSVSLVNGLIASSVGTGAVGKGGDINITAGSLSLTDSSQLLANVEGAANNLAGGRGNGGDININVRGNITFANAKPGILNGIATSVGEGAVGNGGKVTINTDSLEIKDGSEIQASTSGKGDSSSIAINARNISLDSKDENTVFSRITNVVQPSAEGNAGGIQITTGTLTASDGAYIGSSSLGKGNAGNIIINASDAIKLDGSGTREFNGTVIDSSTSLDSELLTGGVGKGGDIQLTTGSLSVTNGAQIISGTGGRGNAGNITINARDAVNITGFASNFPLSNSQVSSSAISNSVGNGGDIRISAGTLLFQNGGSLLATSGGQGKAGNIFLTANNTVTFDGTGNSGLPSSANTYAENGNGGNIQVKTGSLFLTNGGIISSSIQGKGNAGNITIDARDVVKIDGVGKDIPSSSISSALLNAEGRGGDIQITTNTLKVSNGGYITSGGTTNGEGNAGNIMINARDTVTFDNAYLSSFLNGYGGNGGDIRLTTGSLSLTNSFLAASTYGYGNSGNVIIDARDSVSLNGLSGVLSTVESGAVGNGGKIRLTTGSLSLTNGAQLSAYTLGQGNAGNVIVNARDRINLDNSGFSVVSSGLGKAGNLDVTARSIQLDHKGIFSAQTTSGNGGNITLTPFDLLILRHGSQISTTAGIAQLGGDGGNITINTPNGFIVGVPNEKSDIIANAFSGSGGKIQINATSVFGLPVLSREDLIKLLGNNDLAQLDFQRLPTSAITAVSQTNPTLNGTVVINTDNINPSQELVPLSTNLIDSNTLIANSCIARTKKQQGTFNITGTGGLPNRPGDAFISSYPTGIVRNVQGNGTSSSWHKGNSIVEPQGVYQLPNGHLVLSRECS